MYISIQYDCRKVSNVSCIRYLKFISFEIIIQSKLKKFVTIFVNHTQWDSEQFTVHFCDTFKGNNY